MKDELKEAVGSIPLPAELTERSRLGIERASREQRRDRSRKRWSAVAVASVAAFALLSLAQTNERVWAAIQRALQFVPGIGVMDDESRNGDSPRYVLERPVTVKLDEGTLVITGLTTDDSMTYLTVTADHVMVSDSVEITNADGRSATVKRSMRVGSGWQWQADYWYDGELDLGERISLTFAGYPDRVIPLTLQEASSYGSYEEMGPTALANGVSITAVPGLAEDGRARIGLVTPKSEQYWVNSYLIGYPLHESKPLTVKDETGRSYAAEPERGTSAPTRTFNFTLPDDAAAHTYTVDIPEISVTNHGEMKVKIPVPEKGMQDIGRTVDLGGFALTLQRAERIDETTLRVYVDTHYDENAPMSLYDFQLGEGVSSMFKFDEVTRADEYFQIAVEPDARAVKLTLTDPQVEIRGPWTLRIPGTDLQP